MAKYLIGVDNGGTYTKATVFDLEGNEIATASGKTPSINLKAGYVERDMSILWEITASTIKKAINKAGILSHEIIAVGCTGHGKGLYLWGKDNLPAYNGIASTDNRAVDIIKRWNEDGVSSKAYLKTYQNPIACQPVALLAWIKENEPSVYSNIKWIFEAKDFIRFMLTNEPFAEITDYSGTSMLNLETKEFDLELLELFGISEVFDKLPPLKISTDICGYISAKASGMTGLPEGIAVCGGMFDIDACAIAMNVSDEENICVITGTWSINEYLSKNPVLSSKTTLNSIFCIPGFYLIEESSPTSAGNIEWLNELFFSISGKKLSYEEIDNAVEDIEIDDSNIIFVPFLYGSNSELLSNAVFAGLENRHGYKHLLRAVYEGVAFSHKTHVDRLLKTRGKPKAIRLAGGVSKSKVWAQIFADVLGMPVEIVETSELGTLGCAIAAAVSAGKFENIVDAAEKMTKITHTIYPKNENTNKYNLKYEKYKKITEFERI